MLAGLVLAALIVGPLEGRWSDQPEFCDRPQEDFSAPALIGPGRLDQHESHCRWEALKSVGPGAWTAAGRCSIEGDTSQGGLRFTLRGQSLAVRLTNGVAVRYRRCPGS